MEKQVDSAADPEASTELRSEVSREEFTSVMTALEPDQIISTKEHHHCPRRRLTRTEMTLFWALRIYLVFMVGVVIYQIWTSAH